MRGRKKYDASAGEPPRWRITEWNGGLIVVLVDMASPLMPGEVLVWEGAARYMTEAYRLARDSGLPVYMTKEGFKLRASTPSPVGVPPSRRPRRGVDKKPN